MMAPHRAHQVGRVISACLLDDHRCQKGIAVMLMLIINGEGTCRPKHMLLAGRGLPTYKPNRTIRPLTMPEVLYKIAGKINLR